jgi:TRAP-type C4-dicarboxylate transport system permease small subunit
LGLSSDVPQWILPLGFGLMALRFVLRAALGPRRT